MIFFLHKKIIIQIHLLLIVINNFEILQSIFMFRNDNEATVRLAEERAPGSVVLTGKPFIDITLCIKQKEIGNLTIV